MGNTGRKYNREKWGWKDESEIIKRGEHCHYSGLPSPTSYENKHPYYDSDRKKRTNEFAIKAICLSFVSLVVVIIIMSIFS